MSTKTHFEKEAKGNSEMAYSKLAYLAFRGAHMRIAMLKCVRLQGGLCEYSLKSKLMFFFFNFP